jgi:MFS transporter, DHA1 family, multidrug resistance protein
MEASRRNLVALSFAQFGNALSWNFIQIFLPFHILTISPYPRQYTLLWIGAIMGVSGIISAFTSPLWGALTHRFSPKLLYLRAITGNGLAFLLMGFTTDLHFLFLLRMLQGFVSGPSTIGMIIVSSTSSKDRVAADLGFYQSSSTLGQLVGPLIGSVAAAALGYKGAFMSASAVVFLSLIFFYHYGINVPLLPKKEKKAIRRATIDKRVLIGWALCFTTTIQLAFLPSVLPNVFEKFRVPQPVALRLAGMVVMFYTGTAMIGTYVWSLLSRKYGLYRMITFLFALGVSMQLLLSLSRGVVDFTVIRMVQTGLMAATFPLVISIFASQSEGSIIGFMNSARFAGNSLGPIMATSILAISDLTSLYFFIGALTLSALLGFKVYFK